MLDGDAMAAKARRDTRALSISGLAFFSAGRALVDVPDLNLSPDGVSVFMGPNGAGKSLLLRLAHGLIEVEVKLQEVCGEIFCRGEYFDEFWCGRVESGNLVVDGDVIGVG